MKPLSNPRHALLIAVLAFGVVLAAYAVFGNSNAGSPTPAISASTPLVVIFMENKERSSIETSVDAVYLKSFEAAGTSFTHYYGVTHPSLPNYLSLGNASTDGKTGTDSISAGEIAGKNLWSQLQRKGVSWGVYEESMPSACYKGGSSGNYQLKHNPAMPFTNIANSATKCNKVMPFTSFNTSALPTVSFIAPNMCNDMHDCSIATGDKWLAAHVPAMLAAGAEVVITFDEGSSGTNGGGNIYTAMRGPGIGSSVNTATFNHYNLIAAIEDREGVARLNSAVGKTALPI